MSLYNCFIVLSDSRISANITDIITGIFRVNIFHNLIDNRMRNSEIKEFMKFLKCKNIVLPHENEIFLEEANYSYFIINM